MATFDVSTLTNAAISHKQPITMQQGRALRDNLEASFEGAAGAWRLQDAALDTTATATGLSWVAARLQLAGVGNGGTYALLREITITNNYAPGATAAGSLFYYASASGGTTGVSPPGTWRCMGIASIGSSVANTTLWLRIS